MHEAIFDEDKVTDLKRKRSKTTKALPYPNLIYNKKKNIVS